MRDGDEAIEVDASAVFSLRPGLQEALVISRRRTEHHRSGTGAATTFTRTELDPGPESEQESIVRAESLRLAPLLDQIAERAAAGNSPDTTVGLQFRYGSRTVHDEHDERGDPRAVSSYDIFLKVAGPNYSSMRWIRDITVLSQLTPHTWTLLAPPPPAENRARTPSPARVILSGGVAGILIHELIGHAIEESQAPHDRPVLPEGAVVTTAPAGHPGIREISCSTLIDDGRLAQHKEPGGQAEKGLGAHRRRVLHGLRPQLRLPCLTVTAPSTIALSSEDSSLVCQAASGARYFSGIAVVDVQVAHFMLGGSSRPAGPVRLAVTHDDLAASRFIAEPAADTRLWAATGGVCVKNTEQLPSFVDSPAMVLPASVARTAGPV